MRTSFYNRPGTVGEANSFPCNSACRGKNARQRGYVLIIVLVVCLGLVSMTLLFAHAMAMAYRGSETDIAGRQADRAIEGAVQYAEYLMQNVQTPGYLLPDPTLYQSGTVPVGDATFWFIGDPATSGSSAGTNTPAFGLMDEASKLNINTASLAMLENLPNMTQNLAQAIVTWRTSGTSTTSSSASTGASSSTPSSKGGPFESIYELAQVCMVDGDDISILYGNDTNLNHVVDANEDSGGQYNPGIYEYVTAFSREPNTMADGTKRLNVTAPSAALTQLLETKFGTTRGRQIARQTAGEPIRSVLEYYVRSGMTAAEFAQISDYLTMSNGNYAVGLVNVNTASEAVLECIPGITQQLADQLISTRTGQTTPATNLAWVVPILGRPVSFQAGPYLTAKTYQVTADIAAVGPNGRGYRRTQFVIDGSTGTPQVVYRHNMASLGWALGPDALSTVGQQNTLLKTTP